jgi:hypothetical protein
MSGPMSTGVHSRLRLQSLSESDDIDWELPVIGAEQRSSGLFSCGLMLRNGHIEILYKLRR